MSFGIFSAKNRLLYGSDWPNGDQWGTYRQALTVVRDYFASKGPAAVQDYFWKNSLQAYRWKQRMPTQPGK